MHLWTLSLRWTLQIVVLLYESFWRLAPYLLDLDATVQLALINCKSFPSPWKDQNLDSLMNRITKGFLFMMFNVQGTSSYSLWRFAPTSPFFRRSAPTPRPLFGASRRLLTFSLALRANSSPFLRRSAPNCRTLLGAPRRLPHFSQSSSTPKPRLLTV